MTVKIQLSLKPGEAADEKMIAVKAAAASGLDPSGIYSIRILKRSVDARQKIIRVILTVELLTEKDDISRIEPFRTRDVSSSAEVLIIGAGPAGLFAALRLIELGLRPVILERGKDVSSRKKDIARISREHVVDPDSNYCFGEGGAGTFSDGKLYTRSKKRGDNSRVLELLCHFGAGKNILYEAHPHLGTDKLPGIITSVRKAIIDAGGLIMFETRIRDLILEGARIKGVISEDNRKFLSPWVILAAGHSARDVYDILLRNNISMEMKSFAVGVRAEHPQELIDRMQYHGNPRGEYLPAASYSLVRQVEGRGVYSFCMCPGGFIVPSATSQEEVVVNGMSPSGRSSPYANSGIVTEIRPGDLSEYSKYGVMAGLEFQKRIEHDAWLNGDRTQKAPAQRLTDFIDGKTSANLPKVSYFPGVVSSPLHSWLPGKVVASLQEGIRQFGGIMKGYVTSEAAVLGVESRTSSPVRIPRDPESLEHINISGLYPAGEGSGYAGGIVSSAVDGMRIAEKIALKSSQ